MNMSYNPLIYSNYISNSYFKPYIPDYISLDEEIEKASYLYFLLKPISMEAKALTESLIESAKPDMGRRKKLPPEFINAMEHTIPMLLKAAGEEGGGFVYRSMATESFKAGAF